MKAKKIELTKKQKDFLKKIGVVAGIVSAVGGAFYIFNRSEIGFITKDLLIKKLQDSMIMKNGKFFVITVTGSKALFTEENTAEALDAAFSVLKPIVDEYNKR